ncbi:hypothetical protein MAM1_0184d07485 [Mucor ambiguus]|uniref:Chromosome segregation in meiosis protein n=1 Tax=Mucor ambiguus TaxID=91626 RepID=A0A0C9LW64_9FUNG|nr:hypothetical protein MAM1_0184d07485 [Mucor ambiguus]
MDDEFDDILLDDYNIDILDRAQTNIPSLDDGNDESQATKITKKPYKKKFDADLLLQPNGIPLLKSEAQYMKFKKTRGQEHEDLKKLMTYYTIWANNLYPGLLFRDFARRVVNPAKSKTVRSLMDQWSEEYRDRRQVRLDVRNELSGKTVGGNASPLRDIDKGHVFKVMYVNLDEDGSDGNQPNRPAEDDESSEDDNRPLFFPITNTNRASSVANTQNKITGKSKRKGKSKANPVVKPRTMASIDTNDEEDDDEQPLFTSSQQQQQQSNKRKIVLDDSSDEEDTYNMSRSTALALIIERKRKREQAQREEQKRPTRPKSSTSRPIIEDYDDDDNEDEPTLFDRQDKDEHVELALSDSEPAALGIPTQKQKDSFSPNDDDSVENVQLALTDAELLALRLPVNKSADAATTTAGADAVDDTIQWTLSDSKLESLGPATKSKATTPTNNAQLQQQTAEEEQFSDNELFDIQEA